MKNYSGRLLEKSALSFLAENLVVAFRADVVVAFQIRIAGSGKFLCPRLVRASFMRSPRAADLEIRSVAG